MLTMPRLFSKNAYALPLLILTMTLGNIIISIIEMWKLKQEAVHMPKVT